MDPIEYVCDECGKSVMVRPYTEDEVTLVGDWTDEFDSEGMCCGECAAKLRADADPWEPPCVCEGLEDFGYGRDVCPVHSA